MNCQAVISYRLWGVILLATAVGVSNAHAQSGLRASLERLDSNQDGSISPDEITPLARPYLERIAESRGIRLDRPTPVDKFQEAARIYHAMRNGISREEITVQLNDGLQEFGPDPAQPLVPDFGLSEIKYPYTQEDLAQADQSLRRYDRDKDGTLDREEAIKGRWTHRDPFEMDLDKNDRLTRMELTQRYARRRLLDGATDELIQKARRTGSEVAPLERQDPPASRRRDTRYYLPATVMGRFDQNRNGRLELHEADGLGIPTGRLDVDRDGVLSSDEINAFMLEMQDHADGLSEALPSWFYELDFNRDEQVAMAEFSDDWTDEKLAEFAAYDSNVDGFLTPDEILAASAIGAGSYRNGDAQILSPRKTVISEIDIPDDFIIGDLNVQLSITHTYSSYLDVYVTGPDGQRVELFTGVGGSDDHFDQTILDDQSHFPITKARPPFKGTFIPEAMINGQPSLSSFNGKNAKGVWQLVIRASRSDRFGMLHNWALIIKPQSELIGLIAAPANDGPQAATAQTRSVKPSDADKLRAMTITRAKEAAPRGEKPSFQWQPKKDWRQMDQGEREKAIEQKKQAYEKYREFLERRKQQDAGGKREYDKGDYEKRKYDKNTEAIRVKKAESGLKLKLQK